MNKEQHSNYFNFTLYQGDEIISTRIFDADQFNPITRYSVDIRGIIPTINYRLQKTLSNKKPTYIYGEYDLLNSYEYLRDSWGSKNWGNKLDTPEYKVQTFNGKTIKGVEFKFGLYINKNPIVERDFYVDGYNPKTRFSKELIDTIQEICSDIYHNIRVDDIKNMWDDYFVINTYGINSQQIRELPDFERDEMIKKINDRRFVKYKIKKFR